MIIVIEKLSISSLISLFVKIRKLKVSDKKRDYYYVFIDKYMIYVKKFIEMLFSFKFTLFNFTFESVKENNGVNTGMYILYNDLQDFFNSIDLDIDNLDLNSDTESLDDDSVLIEDDSDIDPAADVGIKTTEENKEDL